MDILRRGDMNKFVTLAVGVCLMCFCHINEAKRCTEVLSRDNIQEIIWKEPCVKKYEDRCSFFSLSYCVFYHQMFCEQKKNATVKVYYIKTDCCDGYYLAENGTCVVKQRGVVYSEVTRTDSPEDPNYVEAPISQPKKQAPDEVKLSAGGYAGVVCGIVLVGCITAFTVVAIKKKKRRKKSPDSNGIQMLYHDPAHSRSSPTSPTASVASRTPSTSQKRDSTSPSTVIRVTPPRSPVRHSSPKDVADPSVTGPANNTPLLSNTEHEEDIPESDV